MVDSTNLFYNFDLIILPCPAIQKYFLLAQTTTNKAL